MMMMMIFGLFLLCSLSSLTHAHPIPRLQDIHEEPEPSISDNVRSVAQSIADAFLNIPQQFSGFFFPEPLVKTHDHLETSSNKHNKLKIRVIIRKRLQTSTTAITHKTTTFSQSQPATGLLTNFFFPPVQTRNHLATSSNQHNKLETRGITHQQLQTSTTAIATTTTKAAKPSTTAITTSRTTTALKPATSLSITTSATTCALIPPAFKYNLN